MEERQEIEVEAEAKDDDVIEELLAKDVTADLEIKAEPEEVIEETEQEVREDHPGVILLDMAFEQSREYCMRNNLPPPASKVYREFSRPFLNKAFWHYFPEGNLPDSPKLALLLGIAGFGLAYIPTIMAYYDKNRREAQFRAETHVKVEQRQEGEEVKEPEQRTRMDRPYPRLAWEAGSR